MMCRLNTSKSTAVGVGFSQVSGKDRAVRIGIGVCELWGEGTAV
jgi:hypothetical protein